jgi:hypothetical protein
LGLDDGKLFGFNDLIGPKRGRCCCMHTPAGA